METASQSIFPWLWAAEELPQEVLSMVLSPLSEHGGGWSCGLKPPSQFSFLLKPCFRIKHICFFYFIILFLISFFVLFLPGIFVKSPLCLWIGTSQDPPWIFEPSPVIAWWQGETPQNPPQPFSSLPSLSPPVSLWEGSAT